MCCVYRHKYTFNTKRKNLYIIHVYEFVEQTAPEKQDCEINYRPHIDRRVWECETKQYKINKKKIQKQLHKSNVRANETKRLLAYSHFFVLLIRLFFFPLRSYWLMLLLLFLCCFDFNCRWSKQTSHWYVYACIVYDTQEVVFYRLARKIVA